MTRAKPFSTRFIDHDLLLQSQSYALEELQKDVEQELLSHPEPERDSLRQKTKFGIFVVHNKKKPKLGQLPPDTP